jgi:capsid assembly protease
VVSAGGALVHRTKLDADCTMLLGYNDLAMATEHAMQNPDVHAVLQVYDSPGGEVQGAFEYAQRMFDLRGKKPLIAMADGMAASAAYLGASAADEVVVSRTGYAGSIGVVMRHMEFSRLLANEGIKVTHIFAGAHKVDGNQFEALPATVQAELQAEVDDLYSQFVGAVLQHRPRMTDEAIRKTEARVFRGVAAVAAGLADRMATTDQLISELAARRPTRSYGQPARATAEQKGDTTMSGTQAQAGSQAPVATFTQTDLDATYQRGLTAGREEGAKAERERASAILAHDEAKDRGALALQCVTTGLSVEQSAAILAAAPKVAPAAAANGFAAAMAGVRNPDVRAGESKGTESDPKAIASMWEQAHGTA